MEREERYEEEEEERMEKEGGDFECNICLEAVGEPVVTFCGHLFCWPCIYNWTTTNTNKCPVCKAEVSQATLIPIYGRGRYTYTPHHDDHLVIPTRPSPPPLPPQPQCSAFNQHYTYSMPDPLTGVLCDMVHRRLFGHSSAAPPPMSRREMQSHQSLSRLYFFLVCSMLMCLLLF